MAGYETFQIEITKSYTNTEWRDDLKKVIKIINLRYLLRINLISIVRSYSFTIKFTDYSDFSYYLKSKLENALLSTKNTFFLSS